MWLFCGPVIVPFSIIFQSTVRLGLQPCGRLFPCVAMSSPKDSRGQTPRKRKPTPLDLSEGSVPSSTRVESSGSGRSSLTSVRPVFRATHATIMGWWSCWVTCRCPPPHVCRFCCPCSFRMFLLLLLCFASSIFRSLPLAGA